MMIKKINLIYFSPTKTTYKIVNAIAKGVGSENVNSINITTEYPENTVLISKEELTIFGAPVYGGRIPPDAVKRFKKISSQNSPAVIVAVYGNRHYDDALLELNDLVSELGFKIIAAGAFIGEHSFSINGVDVAKNRPDKRDIAMAYDFGKNLNKKLSSKNNIELQEIPGNYPYKKRNNNPPEKAPETDYDNCNLCQTCIEVCPTQAISLNKYIQTNTEQCIWCCACIKSCPQNARIMTYDAIENIQKWLFENCQARKEPEMFL